MASILSRAKQQDISVTRQPAKDRRQGASLTRKLPGMVAMACVCAVLGACENAPKNIYDYLNIRNSLLDPSQVGRFDKENPWGNVRPVKWPILDQLDVIDQSVDEWAMASEPAPSDLVVDKKESTIGAGDVVHVSIFGLLSPEQEWTRELYVNQGGTITIPYLGVAPIGGLTAQQAQDKLAELAISRSVLAAPGPNNPGPQISVTVVQSAGRVFSVLGAVARPGTYNIYSPDLRILMALSQVGDISGSQPGLNSIGQTGLNYLYIIRAPEAAPANGQAPAVGPETTPPGTTGMPAGTPEKNPLEALESIEKNAGSATKPATEPSTVPGATSNPAATPAPMGPGSTGPVSARPVPTAVVISNNKGTEGMVAQADLDAALSGTVPGAAASTAPTSQPATTNPAEDLLNQAIGMPTSSRPGQHVFVGDKWVTLPGTATAPSATQPAMVIPPAPIAGTPAPGMPQTGVAGAPATTLPGDIYSATENLTAPRVIRIPIASLRTGDPRYNVVIRPGDVINVPAVDPGYFYLMGHVSRPGVFALNGQKITLKQAVAAAGNLDGLAIPRRCDLIRRIGPNQEAIVQVNLQAIFDGDQPDIFLKANDVVNIGTDFVAPFLSVTRNAYRLSYGFGFVYDRNYASKTQ